MTRYRHLIIAPLAFAALAGSASAQSVPFMLGECESVAQTYFGDWEARSEIVYNGQRTNGTHAINGTIYLETRAEDYACSYDRRGRNMVEFFAEGRARNAYLPGGGSGGGQGSSTVVEVTGIRGNDVLNVRGGPGNDYRIIGALSNGTKVRRLNCQDQGNSTWCQIEMITDMRERGWVNARFLSSGSVTQLPEKPPQAGVGGDRTVRVRFPAGSSSASLTGTLAPGEARRYVLGARKLQDLSVRVSAEGSGLFFQIFNPDRSFLLDQVPARQTYSGQLWQTGDHIVEIINRGNRARTFSVRLSIQ
jgi:uncharacterized protein YgiM (DUF1202 family)